MGHKRTDEFRADAVRNALTSGLTRKQAVSDLGAGESIRLSRRRFGSFPFKVSRDKGCFWRCFCRDTRHSS